MRSHEKGYCCSCAEQLALRAGRDEESSGFTADQGGISRHPRRAGVGWLTMAMAMGQL